VKLLLIRASQVIGLLLAACLLLGAQAANKSVPVTITVTDESGAPIPQAKTEIISVANADGKTAVTDSTGSARFELLAGDYDVIVTAQAFKTLSRRVSVSAGEGQKLEFALRVSTCPPGPCAVFPGPAEEKDLVTATILVVDPTGAVIPDTQIKLLPDAFVKASRDPKTDEKGEVSVKLLPGIYYLFAAVPVFLPAEETVQVQAAPNQTFRIALQLAERTRTVEVGRPSLPVSENLVDGSHPPPIASASLTINVTDSVGGPIPYAQIGGLPPEAVWKFPEADEAGKFNLKLAPGDYDVVVTSPTYLRWTKHIQVRSGDSRTLRVLLTRADF
jgi:hypothetical protein